MSVSPGVPRITYLKVENYRALKRLEMKGVEPLTVLLGPNGSGKSTVFDVFAFLSESFNEGLRRACDRRGKLSELRSRGSDGPIRITLKYLDGATSRSLTFSLAIDEDGRGPYVAEERLSWTRGSRGKPFDFLNFESGKGRVISGEIPDEGDDRVDEELDREALATATLGQFARHPRVSALRRFITDWYLSYLTADSTRCTPEAGPQERLSQNGDNLANVIQYLGERHPDVLSGVLQVLARRVPRLESVSADMMADGRLLLQIKDAPFDRPVQARYASDGTLKMLAYLTVLHDPEPPQFVGIEEPENHLHPRLLPELAEECRAATEHSQLLLTTHSPFLINELPAKRVWVLDRDERGYTQARCAATMPQVTAMMEEGAKLGHLWAEGYFDCGDPLHEAGGPSARGARGGK